MATQTITKRVLQARYALTKATAAADEFIAHAQLLHQKQTPLPEVLSSSMEAVKHVMDAKFTSTMLFAGMAMYPNLNRQAKNNKNAVEKLVLRSLPRPTSRNLNVGDVVAFYCPIISPTPTVMVRRIMGLEGDEIMSPQNDQFLVPKGHCWVMADNLELKLQDAVDSRTFGHLQLSNVIGRIIYQGYSLHDHGPVRNSPAAMEDDLPIIAEEVNVHELFKEEEGEEESQ